MRLLLRLGEVGGIITPAKATPLVASEEIHGDAAVESLNGDLYATRSAGATTHCARGNRIVREDVIPRRVGSHKFQDSARSALAALMTGRHDANTVYRSVIIVRKDLKVSRQAARATRGKVIVEICGV